jgi:hypothetical protein
MKYRYWLFLALAAISATGLKAAPPSEDDEEDFSDIGFYANAKNNLTFGFRVNQGAKVHFSRLGAVTVPPVISTADGASYPNGPRTTYTYTNGQVIGDSLRTNEVKINPDGTIATDANGKYIQTSTPGTRYTTNSGIQYDGNGNIIVGSDGAPLIVTTGSFLAYTPATATSPGLTRAYGFDGGAQVLDDGSGLVFTQYSASSDGEGADGKREMATGVELQVGRQFGKFAGGRMEFSVVGGISLNDINSSAAGNVHAKLHMVQDTFYFAPGGTLPTDISGIYTAPTFGDYTDETGGVHLGTNESTVPLQDTPDASKHVDKDAGSVDVSGVWKIRGAFFGLRVGSEVRAMVSKNFGLSVGAGVAGAYASTRFTAQEQFTLDGIATPISVTEFNDTSKFLPGYYANVDASYSINERTGVYAGVGYDAYDSYDQTIGGRTAKIDIGNSPTVRGGISIKF